MLFFQSLFDVNILIHLNIYARVLLFIHLLFSRVFSFGFCVPVFDDIAPCTLFTCSDVISWCYFVVKIFYYRFDSFNVALITKTNKREGERVRETQVKFDSRRSQKREKTLVEWLSEWHKWSSVHLFHFFVVIFFCFFRFYSDLLQHFYDFVAMIVSLHWPQTSKLNSK